MLELLEALKKSNLKKEYKDEMVRRLTQPAEGSIETETKTYYTHHQSFDGVNFEPPEGQGWEALHKYPETEGNSSIIALWKIIWARVV